MSKPYQINFKHGLIKKQWLDYRSISEILKAVKKYSDKLKLK